MCWNGNNCDRVECQDCPFSCRMATNVKSYSYDCNDCSFEDDEEEEEEEEERSKAKGNQPAKMLPPQCQTVHTQTCTHRCMSVERDCGKKMCSSCSFCQMNNVNNEKNATSPSLHSALPICKTQTNFIDHTETVLFSKTPKYFKRNLHSGRPYFHYGPPTFFHLDSDGHLDYFNSMHGHPLFSTSELRLRLELALNKVVKKNDEDEDALKNNHEIHNVTENDGYESIDFDDDILHQQQPSSASSPTASHTISQKDYGLRQISKQIIIEDSITDLEFVDLHGCIIADIDNDGYLDIYISNGGNRGQGVEGEEDRVNLLDNMLFWGEPSSTLTDAKTGLPLTSFRGGRQAAVNANVHMRGSRGRFVTIIDANRDGWMDLFVSQDRTVINDIVPGYLLINNGDRTFRKDTSVQEYTRAMLLTDADGDGIADELVIGRSFCFPHRDGPDVDPLYPELGPFTDESKKFCSTRPVGTTAVYKYNEESGTMNDIAKPYVHFNGLDYQQPTCCPHTSYDGSNNCNPISIVSDDFDNDELADHIYIYKYKMEFYFSSDRRVSVGDVLDEPVVGNPNYMGLRIDFPSYCSAAITASVVDLDNNGHDEIFVTCENAGTFLVYTRDESQMFSGDSTSSSISSTYKRSWTLENGCNNDSGVEFPLGQINDRFLAAPTKEDMEGMCNDEYDAWGVVHEICAQYRKDNDEIPAAKTTGVAIIDWNNDGFWDVVLSHSMGYLRFFHNEPLGEVAKHRFITFSLSDTKMYGIGTTLILHCIDHVNGQKFTQFHEVTSHQHGSDKHSTKDEKIIFGLGQTILPEKLVVRWPTDEHNTKKVQEIDLSSWDFSQTHSKVSGGSHDGGNAALHPPIKIAMQSHQPSDNPVLKTSLKPSVAPSQNPTDLPTQSPSASPAVHPTLQPTSIPSRNLSNLPSLSPSKSLSPTESKHPSTGPTISFSPSSTPTSEPSIGPSSSQKPSSYSNMNESAGSKWWICCTYYKIILIGVIGAVI